MNATPLSQQGIRALMRRHTVARYHAGQVLFYAGHVPHGLWILVSGAVLLKPASGRRRQISAPAIFGWNELLETRAYDATATAMLPCEIAFFPRQEVMDRLEQFAKLVTP